MARVARRRWWVVVVCAVLGTLAAAGVSSRTPSLYQAESVVVAPAIPAGGVPPGLPDAAVKLATTYASLIPLDDAVIAEAAATASVTTVALRRSLTVTNDPGTALIRIMVQASTPQLAVNSSAAVATVVTKPNPPGQVANGSLKQVTIANSATVVSESGPSSLGIGALLGLILGLVIVAAFERSDRRIDVVDDLVAVTGPGVSSWAGITPEEARALAHRWQTLAGAAEPVVAFVGTGSLTQLDVEDLLADLADKADGLVGGPPALAMRREGLDGALLTEADVAHLIATGRPGHDEGAELVAQTCDLVVLVVAEGARLKQALAARDRLAQFGVYPSWGLLAPRKLPHRSHSPRVPIQV